MSVRQFNFSFSELVLDMEVIRSVLGFPDPPLPEPFDAFLQEALDFAAGLNGIKGAYRMVEPVLIDPSTGIVMADGITFEVGKTICRELRGSRKLLFFVCTAGPELGERSSELLRGEDPVRGYMYDQIGTFLAEAAGDRLQKLCREEAGLSGDKITNRYSPGYCQWEVSGQHLLFSLFPPGICGVTLTSSSLMSPVKSISGIIGAGEEVQFREYPCQLCQSLKCVYRKVKA